MLADKIYQDYVTALKAKNKEKTSFLSFIRADLQNKAIELKKDKLADEEVLTALKKLQKRLLDTKESLAQSQRTDLIESADKELALLEEYLPKPLTDAELLKIIDEAISQAGASSMKDMGKVMKEVNAKVGVRADAKKISQLVKQKLTPK
ncbi:MAG: GatB/YqeY domain-containing protein [Candidatus Omnitrophica bacterium]|nr:GatB/YqeY domain-containing protein [Candidatus Omnitrophota bacterium]MBU2251207.1 GatB/YqeY domain-containing protein [Candidatus Omnitrophota bacterium]MBU2266312.1 GatB/YqeY domain-containing protein [Candidatus Omnitrophota bacterium]